jgi:hypothetical protein
MNSRRIGNKDLEKIGRRAYFPRFGWKILILLLIPTYCFYGAEGGNRTHTTLASPRILRSCHRLPATHSGSTFCISNVFYLNQLHLTASKQDLRFLGPICIGLEKNRQEIGRRLQPGHIRCAADLSPDLCIAPILQGSSPLQTEKDSDLILFLKESGATDSSCFTFDEMTLPGSQEVASSILAISTNKINHLQKQP